MAVKEDTFVTILPFMANDLHLGGNELLTYAIIHGFTMYGEDGWFTGSASYIAEWCQCSKRAVFNILKRLVEKGLIERRERVMNGVTLVDYRCKNFTGVVKEFHRGSENSSLQTIDIDTDRRKDRDSGSARRAGKFTPPSLEECRAYAKERGLSVDPDRFHEYFEAGDWHDSKGSPVRNWKQKMLTWEKMSPRDRGRPSPSPERRLVEMPYGLVYEDELRTDEELESMPKLQRMAYYNNAAAKRKRRERGEL